MPLGKPGVMTVLFRCQGMLSLVQKTAGMNAHDVYTELGLTRRSYIGKKAISFLEAT